MDTPTQRTDSLLLSPRVRHRAVGQDGVVVHLENGRVLVVNEVGLRIIELLAEPINRAALAARIAEEFEVTAEDAEADLDHYLDELDAEQVLANHTTDDVR